MFIGGGGLLLFILDIFCLYEILTSGTRDDRKLLWVIIVIFLPLLGPILYFLLGRGARI